MHIMRARTSYDTCSLRHCDIISVAQWPLIEFSDSDFRVHADNARMHIVLDWLPRAHACMILLTGWPRAHTHESCDWMPRAHACRVSKMTVQHRCQASYKQAIVDILTADDKTPMSSILEQLAAKFPNITPRGFEGAKMQV